MRDRRTRNFSAMNVIQGASYLLSCLWAVFLFLPTCAITEAVEAEGSSRVVYDQRQTGKYNIHVSIKDVAIIEMDQNEFEDESNDEEYYYDDNDLTVKPLPSWITKPTTATSSKPTTDPTTTKPLSQNYDSFTTNVSNHSHSSQTPPHSIPISLSHLTTSLPNITYSPNLLADLAATQAAAAFSSNTTLPPTAMRASASTKTPPSKASSRKTTNVVILSTTPSPIPSASSTYLPAIAPALGSARSQGQDIVEPVLHPKQRQSNLSKLVKRPQTDVHVVPPNSNQEENDSKIFKFKVRRAYKQHAAPAYPIPFRYGFGQRRCRSGHFLDESGNCRMKRSSSFLKKLFSMLVSLPLNDSDDIDNSTE